MSNYLIVTYTRFAAEMPVAVHRANSLEEARRFIHDFEQREQPLAAEIVLDRTGDPHGDCNSAA
ncbi:MAG: hypothetical protein ACIALR_13555 [Blastopirellula sp. JB062]